MVVADFFMSKNLKKSTFGIYEKPIWGMVFCPVPIMEKLRTFLFIEIAGFRDIF